MEVGHFWQRILGSDKQASFIKSAEDPPFSEFTNLIAQLPAELTSKRDEYQNVAKIWSVVRDDLLRIRKFCLSENKTIENRLNAGLIDSAFQEIQPIKVGRIVTAGWQTVASSGDCITATDAKD